MENRKTRKELSSITRDNILQATVKLFSSRDFDDVKITDICEEAGVSVGAFYHHYQSKDDVVNESHIAFDRDIDDQLQAFVFERAIDKLCMLIRIVFQGFMNQPYLFHSVVYSRQLLISNKYAGNPSRRYYRLIYELVQQAKENKEIESPLSATEIDKILRTIIRGAIYNWLMAEGKYNLLEDTFQQIANIFPWFPQTT